MNNIIKILTATSLILTLGTSINAYSITSDEGKLECSKGKITFQGGTSISNGLNLYSREMGEGHATVVFECGYSSIGGGSALDDFEKIQNSISMYTRTISYDRAGCGQSTNTGNMEPLSLSDKETLMNGGIISYKESEFTGLSKTARDKAINLHKLLEARNIPKPYILVAHSMGGHTAIEFTQMYKDEVAGIVFLDSASPNSIYENIEFFKKYAPEQIDGFLSMFSPKDGTLDEVLMSQNQVKNDSRVLKNVPILYLQSDPTYNMPPETHNIISEFRKNQVDSILKLSDKSHYKMIDGTSHMLHTDKPKEVGNEIMKFIYRYEYEK